MRIRNNLVKMYSLMTGQTQEQVIIDLDRDNFMSAEEALKYGLIDEIVQPDDEKLKKAVRKIRFFLHPDKLPRDLNAEQSFACRMLWDVTSDSWEEHCKQKEELDWIK